MKYAITVVISIVFLLAFPVVRAQAQDDSNVVALWHFDEGSDTVLHDASPYHNDGIIHNPQWVAGKFGSALHFDGATTYVILPNSPSLKQTQAFTLEAWISLDTLVFPYDPRYPDKDRPILDNLGPYPFGGGYFFGYHNIYGLTFSYRTASGSAIFTRKVDITQQQQFYHVAEVYQWTKLGLDSVTILKTYLNGQLEDSSVFYKKIQYNNAPNFYIGTDLDGKALGGWKVRDFQGVIDEIRISKIALQPTQFNINHFAASPTGMNFGFVKIGNNLTSQLSLQNTSENDTLAIDSILVSNSKFTIDGSPSSVPPQGIATFNVTYTPVTAGVDIGSIRFVSHNSDDAETIVNLIGKAYVDSLDTNVVADWHFDEGEGTILHDASIYANDGKIGGNTQWVKGKKGFGLHFDGLTSFVKVPNSMSLKQTQAFTIEAWFNLDTLGFPNISSPDDRFREIVSNIGTYPYAGGYELDIRNLYGLRLCYRPLNDIRNDFPGTPIPLAHHFYHAAGVFQRTLFGSDTVTMIKTYLNGVLGDSSVYPAPIFYDGCDTLYIGSHIESRAVGGWKVREFQGILDEIKISKVAREPQEFGVTELKASSSNIDFGVIRSSKTASKKLLVANTSFNVTLSVAIQGTLPSVFSVDHTSFDLPPRTQKVLTLNYMPTAEGRDSASFMIVASDTTVDPLPVTLVGAAYDLKQEPIITAVNDIQNDQGRQVRIIWFPSKYDVSPDSLRVNEYSVWRKVEDELSKTVVKNHREGNVFSIHNRKCVVLDGDLWDYITALPSVQFEQYSVVAPTLYNTTIYDTHWSTFMVAAHTTTGEFFFSLPDSGYSLDNVLPYPPDDINALQVGQQVQITWNAAYDPDILEYNIYRSTEHDFVPNSSNRVATTYVPKYVDTNIVSGTKYYYGVTSVDSSFNESKDVTMSTAVLVTGIQNGTGIPTEYTLSQNYPNPFNPVTTISYALPVKSVVKLVVYDILGRPVATLVNETQEAGNYDARWLVNGSSGVYLYKITAISTDNSSQRYENIRKMLYLK